MTARGWRIASGVLASMLALVGAWACDSDPPQCACPSGTAGALVQLPCGQRAVALGLTGLNGCEVDLHLGPETISVEGAFPGTCHVTWTYADGSTGSTDVVFTSIWIQCGSDPHGCGQGVTTSPEVVQIGDACADAGGDAEADAGSSDAGDGEAETAHPNGLDCVAAGGTCEPPPSPGDPYCQMLAPDADQDCDLNSNPSGFVCCVPSADAAADARPE
jgi:hypothetical protein